MHLCVCMNVCTFVHACVCVFCCCEEMPDTSNSRRVYCGSQKFEVMVHHRRKAMAAEHEAVLALYVQLKHRGRRTLVLTLFSPLGLVWDRRPWDSAAHIQDVFPA